MGSHSTSHKTNYVRGGISLRGTVSSGMTVQTNMFVFWKILEIHVEVPPMQVVERKSGLFISFYKSGVQGTK